MFPVNRPTHLYLWIIGIFSFSFIGCDLGSSADEPCTYTEPVAIFEGINKFKAHAFEVNGQESVERISIPDMNMNIELYQSGCHLLRQEYRILLNEPYPLNTPAEICIRHLSNIFLILSQEAPKKLGLFQQWASVLQVDAKKFKYNEKLLLKDTDVYAQVDKTHDTESAMLTIVFEQHDPKDKEKK